MSTQECTCCCEAATIFETLWATFSFWGRKWLQKDLIFSLSSTAGQQKRRSNCEWDISFSLHFLTCFSFYCAEEQAASLALLWCGSWAAAPTLPVTCWLSSLTSSGGINFSNVLWNYGAILLLSSAFGYKRGWYCSQKWAWSIRIPEDGRVLYEITIYFLLFDPSPQKSPLTAVRGFSPRWNLVQCSCLFHMFYFYQLSKAIYIQLFSSE